MLDRPSIAKTVTISARVGLETGLFFSDSGTVTTNPNNGQIQVASKRRISIWVSSSNVEEDNEIKFAWDLGTWKNHKVSKILLIRVDHLVMSSCQPEWVDHRLATAYSILSYQGNSRAVRGSRDRGIRIGLFSYILVQGSVLAGTISDL